jgi:hypothetical protein
MKILGYRDFDLVISPSMLHYFHRDIGIQCSGSALVSIRVQIQHFRPLRIRIQGF